jgi:electron transfer flavoprotein alpha subunit
MRILLLAEHDNLKLKPEFFKTLSAATQICDSIDILVTGFQCEKIAQQISALKVVSFIYLLDDQAYQYHAEEQISLLLKGLAKDYTHVLCSSSSFGKSVLPRVAAYLNVAQISNISTVVSENTYLRPIYAGEYLRKIKSHDSIKVITVMASAFDSIVNQYPDQIDVLKITKLPVTCLLDNNQAVFISKSKTDNTQKSLQSANIVVAAGRGLNSEENFNDLHHLADMLDAAVGATRAVVDAGWMSNDRQIGQTAKTVAPELYIAFGVSGAAQHIAGMKGSKVIIAVNKDPDAPIFKLANYALVADINNVLPKLNELLQS